MNILMLTPYVTINGRAEFSKNKTGFGYMVYDIARAVAQTEQVDVLASDSRGNGFDMDHVSFIKRSFGLFFLNVFRCLSPLVIWRLWSRYKMSFSSLLRLIYYWLISGYYYAVISKGNYNIVHIHGCGFATELWMRVCSKCNQKFVVTLHGLNSFSDTVQSEPAAKQYERDFLKKVVDGEIPITVISTGMKRIIENTYGVSDCNNIAVVCNAFSFNAAKTEIEGDNILNIRQLYGIPNTSKIILYVGNVCRRKNQGQLIKAFDFLEEEIAKKTYVLFLGRNIESEYSIETLSKGSKYASHFISCGVVDKEMVHYYYEQGDAVALMSLSEGFGLSLIESLHFGLPCMSFTDVDAFDDIYNSDVMVGVDDHSDISVAKGVEKLLGDFWDKNQIKQYSKKFESQQMAHNYVKVYQKTVQNA